MQRLTLPYYAGHHSALLRARVERLGLEIRTLADRLAALKEHIAQLPEELDEADAILADTGYFREANVER